MSLHYKSLVTHSSKDIEGQDKEVKVVSEIWHLT